MKRPSINAQIEEMKLLVRKGPSLQAEHTRNREAILRALELARDNAPAIKSAIAAEKEVP